MNLLTIFGQNSPQTIEPADLGDPTLMLDDFIPDHIPVSLEELKTQTSIKQYTRSKDPIHPAGLMFGLAPLVVGKPIGK